LCVIIISQVIQRRVNRLADFDTQWEEYKKGFGDVNADFWLGEMNGVYRL